MLKLEKVAKTLEVSITLRKKEPLLTKNLWIALVVATLLHVGAGLLFNVRAFLFKGSQILIPPVMVESFIVPSQEGSVNVQIDEDSFPRSIKEPKKSEPLLPEWPSEIASNFSSSTPAIEYWKKDPFKRETLLPQLDTPLPSKGVHYHISGPLAKIPLIYAPPPPNFQVYQGHFYVRLEGRTGRLFWFEPLQTHWQDHAIEDWLKEFKFEPVEDTFVEAGEIEVQIG